MIKYFTFRLYPSRAQAARLEATLELCRCFYNQLLSDRLAAHQAGRKLGLYEQLRGVAVARRADACYAAVHSHSLQLVASDVDRAWQTWQRRGFKGKPPAPRREGQVRSFGFKMRDNGFKVDGRRLRIFQIGRVAVRWHRPLQGVVKTLRVYREAGRWFASFACAVEPVPLPATDREVGIDLGVRSLLTLSSGERIPHPGWAMKARQRIAALRERLHRATPGTPAFRRANFMVGRAQARVAAQRRDYLAKIVAWLVSHFDRIGMENLNFARLAALRATVADAGWGALKRRLIAKAAGTGRLVALVNPRWTTQTCSACNCRNRRYLPAGERQFSCESCGYTEDRDVNAARVVLRRARMLWPSCAER